MSEPTLLELSSIGRTPVADVVFDARTGGIEARYTYRADISVAVGDLVLAPLSARPLVGVVIRSYDAGPDDLDFPLEKLRALEARIEGARVPLAMIAMAEFVSRTYLCPFSVALSPAMPPAIGNSLETSWQLDETALDQAEFSLTLLQKEIVELARTKKGRLALPKSAPANQRRAARLLEAKGILTRTTQLATSISAGPAQLYRLTPDEVRIDAYLREQGSRRPAQAVTLIKLRESTSGALTLEDIKALGGVTVAVVKSLVEAGLLEEAAAQSKRPRPAPTPNQEQSHAIQQVVSAISANRAAGFLLFGVTGSGKTEVYLRAAAEALRLGKQVLYLVPEIALATQAIGQLRERFGTRAAVLHSELTPKERLATWMRIAQGQAPIVIGARSALFAPLDNLGLIVFDEEHEGSYKQDSSPRYHAKALARFLAEQHGCPYILGSATPSIETFYEAEQGRVELLELTQRAAKAQLPEVLLEDLGEGYRAGSPAILSEALRTSLQDAVAAGHQAILFLNRRAYAHHLVCRDCGHFFMCPKCAVALTFSRKQMRLRCHHCGYQERPPDTCPKCQGSRFKPLGIGTEKVEEAVQELLPGAQVARLDRDVAQRKGALESILAGFGSGEIDVLVGTQIVAKGLNFPNVTLVGVVAADISLNIPDFRAAERTFQLLSQVAGRAGRGSAPGKVVIQTFNPGNVAVATAQTHDYRAFYREVVREREEAGYPPYRKLVNILFTHESYAAVTHASQQAARNLRMALPEAELLGPTDCAIERVQNRWRKHILLKLAPEAEVAGIAAAVEAVDDKKVQIVVDVDAYSLL